MQHVLSGFNPKQLAYLLRTYQFWCKTRVLYMSFDRFLLAVESRDLSQADKSLIRMSPFPKLSHFQQLSTNNLKDSPRAHPGLTQDSLRWSSTKVVYMFLASESHNLSQAEKEFIQLCKQLILSQIDHVIQQPKETCQTTCRGPRYLCPWFYFSF